MSGKSVDIIEIKRIKEEIEKKYKKWGGNGMRMQ
jgi:hypothetical protein